MPKTVPVSVRLSAEDADFIANLQIADAVTPSDKIRSMIKIAKQQQMRVATFENCLQQSQEALKPLTQAVKAYELELGQHSELLSVFNDWLAESFAYLSSAKLMIEAGELDFNRLEAGIAERVFRLLTAFARMGVTKQAPCYDAELMNKGFEPVLELIQIITQRLTNGGEQHG